MSWGRIDDGFTTHRKVLALRTPTRRWTWLEVLTYTWRYRSPVVPDEIGSVIKGATIGFLDDCERVGLLERNDAGERIVHDWPLYSDATIREKVAYFLDRNQEASANEVCRAIGGTRDLVLAEVRLYHEEHPVRPNQENGTDEPDTAVRPNRQSGSESGTHARAPVPRTTPEEHEGSSRSRTASQAKPLDHPRNGVAEPPPYAAALAEAAALANGRQAGKDEEARKVNTDDIPWGDT